MDKSLKEEQLIILKALAGKIDDFYLVGGTALSLFYCDHRESEDLDFFTKSFSSGRVMQIVTDLEKQLGVEIKPLADNLAESNPFKVMIYTAKMPNYQIKIDFVQDALKLLLPLEVRDGINVLSVDDIYLKKTYAVSGFPTGIDEIGRLTFNGGRQSAKDLFDLYYLSKNHLNLSKFVARYCDQARREGIIRWWNSFDRMEMKLELSEVKTKENIEFIYIDKHIDNEIKIMLREEIS